MQVLIVKEYVRSEGFDNLGLFYPTKEKDFVDVDAPMAKSLYDAHLCRRISRRNDGYPDGGKLNTERKPLLKA